MRAVVDNIPFVGRTGELTELSRVFEEAIARGPRLVLITGEAGIGKTTLVEHAVGSLCGQRVPVLWGRAWEGVRGNPFGVWVDVLRSARVALTFGSALIGVAAGDVDHQLVSLLEEALAGLGRDAGALRAQVMGRLAECLYYDDTAKRRREVLSRQALRLARTSRDSGSWHRSD